MSKNSGLLVSYADKDGKYQLGLVQYRDQQPQFKDLKKVMVRLINEDYTPKMDDKGQLIFSIFIGITHQ